MRFVHMLMLLAMIGFVGVQYNDPDGPLWMVYYAVPAAWAFVAAFRAELLASPGVKRALWVTAALWLALMVFYWPTMAGFWHQEVWWVEETAREGMGMMIAWAVVMLVVFSAWRAAGAPARSLRGGNPGLR